MQQAGIPEGLQAEPLSHWGMVQGLVEGEGPEQGLQEGERLQQGLQGGEGLQSQSLGRRSLEHART